MENDERESAAAQLDALQADRTALAERVVQPWWYDGLLGLLVFQLLASYSAHDTSVTAAAVAVFCVGLLTLVQVYKRRTGMWVNGLRAGPTQRAVRVWFAVYAVVLGSAAAAEYLLDVRGAMVLAGVVLGIGIALTSRWWTRIYVAELRGEHR